MSISAVELYSRINSNVIEHQQYKDATKEFDFIFEITKISDSKEGLLIIADSGSGKTTWAEAMAEKHPPIKEDERWHLPVVILKMPANPTIRGFCQTSLDKLYEMVNYKGERYKQKDGEEKLLHRLITLLKGCGNIILIIDECQHLVDGSKIFKTPYQVGDVLKQIMDEAGVSMVLSGVKSLEVLTNTNEQLANRFSRRVEFNGFNTTSPGIKALNRCIGSFIKRSGYEGDASILLDVNLLEAVYYATDGRVGYIAKLLSESLRLVIDKRAKGLKQTHLAEAFQKSIYKNCTPKTNPFCEQFEVRRLDAEGMPFQPGVRG